MQTSYIKAVEAAAEAIKAVEDINARAEVVKKELQTARGMLVKTIMAEQERSSGLCSGLDALAGQLSKLLAAIEGKGADEEPAEDPQIALAAE